ncbi:hypothetical protein F5I97DRAFT_1927261 [Phlebopus sp. FC_14]|nr:hypothetical protein F5I97DRAFT_1927261 [Phlebopus sp. FC_14]
MSEPQADERSRGSETTNRLKMMTRGISDSYPCAKMALGILSTAYNIFPVEDDHRRYLRPLLDIVYETYTLASETSCLTPDLCTEPLSRLSRYAVECGYFIREFVGKRGILHSLVNQATSIDVDAELKGYIRKFDQLRSCFSTSGEVPRCQTDDEMQSCSSDDIHSESTCNMRRTKSTSTASTLDTVDDILTWANDRGQERICLLSGQHPAISDVTWHVTSLFDSPCSLYSFRHGRKLNDQPRLRHPRYFFGDIANDIAIKHPPFGHVLATSVTSDRDTVDTQFEQLILAPAKRMSDQGSVLVIIDALDECPRGGMRKSILTALAGKAAELLENFRILVTCRYEEDIFDALRDKMHVLERPFDMQC